MNLIVGAKHTNFPGWLSTDLRAPGARLDIRSAEDWARYFAPNSIDKIVAEHVLEHMTYEDGLNALCNFNSYLRQGGRVRVAVPDAYNPDASYREFNRPGGKGQAWQRLFYYASDEPEHRVFYNFETLSALMERAGLTPHLVEYHDAAGRFHRNPWSLEDGPVKRYFNSPHNVNLFAPFHGYQNTSLIIDGVKSSEATALPSCQIEHAPRAAISYPVARDSAGNLILLGGVLLVGIVALLLPWND